MQGQNHFLSDLLTYQQDGSRAISSPKNWNNEPILEVDTTFEDDINKLKYLYDDFPRTGKWHFFIGAPGNGKSAAIGKICRYYKNILKCRIVDKDKNDLDTTHNLFLQHKIYVMRENDPFISAMIVQDASVVENPFNQDMDPASDLLEAMTNAFDEGWSLLVCANRGIIEQAMRLNLQSVNEKRELRYVFRYYLNMMEDPQVLMPPKGMPAFNSIELSKTELDVESIITSGDNELTSPFESLIIDAISKEKWAGCTLCENNKLCPFYQNRNWLSDERLRETFVHTMSLAETYSDQFIVFREALALLSYILAGSSPDYDATGPCFWVNKCINEKDYFALLSRRIFMSLYCSNVPRGLDVNPNIAARQREALEVLDDSRLALTPLSTDVGIQRLLGTEGVMSKIDATNFSIDSQFKEKYSIKQINTSKLPVYVYSELENKCMKYINNLIQKAIDEGGYKSNEQQRLLNRLASNILHHLGVLVEGITYQKRNLEIFQKVASGLTILSRHKNFISKTVELEFYDASDILRGTVRDYFEVDSDEQIGITSNVHITGDWLSSLKPDIDYKTKIEGISIPISFGENNYFTLSASSYLWMCEQTNNKLSNHSIPAHILEGTRDARKRAAISSSYATVEKDISLNIETPENRVITVKRLQGGYVKIENGQ